MARYRVGQDFRRTKPDSTVSAANSRTTGQASGTEGSMGRVSRTKKTDRSVEPIYTFEWRADLHDVYICDPTDAAMEEMVDFCKEQGLKLESYDNTDVSDCSGQWDTIARFRFEDTEDALIFKLRYK
jgi:hypothetical protein